MLFEREEYLTRPPRLGPPTMTGLPAKHRSLSSCSSCNSGLGINRFFSFCAQLDMTSLAEAMALEAVRVKRVPGASRNVEKKERKEKRQQNGTRSEPASACVMALFAIF